MGVAIEAKRIETELLKVTAAKAEMELRILEREEELDRLRGNLQVQDAKIEELKTKLSEIKSGKGN